MPTLHRGCYHTLSDYYIDDEEIARISGFYLSAEGHFQSLAGPRNVSVDFKYDVLCRLVCVYSIPV